MARGSRSPLQFSALVCALIGACSLTESLDDLSVNATGGSAGKPSDASTAGSSGWGIGGGSAGSAAGSGGAASGAGGMTSGGGNSGAGASGGSGASGHDPIWWDPSWPQRVRLTITNGASAELASGFEVGFSIDPSAVFGSDVTTFVIARWDASSWTSRPHYVEQVAGSTFIWTPLATNLASGATDTSLWLYAGSSSPAAADPAAVFSSWDGFDGVSGDWYTNGSPLFQNGELTLTSYSSVRSQALVSPNLAIDFALALDSDVSGKFDWICGGLQRVTDFDNSEPWFLWISRSAGTIHPESKVDALGLDASGTAHGFAVGQQRIYGVERFETETVYRLDHSIADTLPNPSYTTSLQLRFSAQSASAKARLDFVRVRHAASPWPSVEPGSAESGP